MELHAFCQLLPGPTSTQMLMAMGRKMGGPLFSLKALLIWVLPAVILMTSFSILFHYFSTRDLPTGFLKYITPMATGFILANAWFIFRNIRNETSTLTIFFATALITSTGFLGPYLFPILMLLSGFIYFSIKRKPGDFVKTNTRIRWKNFTIFIVIFAISMLIGGYFLVFGSGFETAKPWFIFENNYRFGSLVFGGGNVLIPMMREQFVRFRELMSPDEFITGVGLLQAIPGPVFSLAAYTGSMVMKNDGIAWQIAGSLIACTAIFTPGYLLVQFIYPVWHQLKNHPVINKIFRGILAGSGGLILAAAYLLSGDIGYEAHTLIVMGLTCLVVVFTKISPPIIVLTTVLAGIIF